MTPAENLSHRDLIINTRRALLGDPLSVDVHTWLRRAYVPPAEAITAATAKSTIGAMASGLESAIKADPQIEAALKGITRFISVPAASQYAKAFDSIKRPQSNMFRTFASIVYARALMLQTSSQKDSATLVREVQDVLNSPATFLKKYLEMQEKLDEHFVAHLTTTTEVEAQLDPHFQRMLEHAGALFVDAHLHSQGLRNPFVEADCAFDLFGIEDASAWWRIPICLTFAMTVWHQGA